MITLIDPKQIRWPLLSGMVSSGQPVTFSGNVEVSGNIAADTGNFVTLNTQEIVSPSIVSPMLSGLFQLTVTGSGITYFPSLVDISGNNLNYVANYVCNGTQFLESDTINNIEYWEYLDNSQNIWASFPPLGLSPSQQLGGIVRHLYPSTGMSIGSLYHVGVRPIYDGNITGNYFVSAPFYPQSKGHSVYAGESLAQFYSTADQRYARINNSIISGASISGNDIYVKCGDSFPLSNLGIGELFLSLQDTGLYVYATGENYSGWKLVVPENPTLGASGIVLITSGNTTIIAPNLGTGYGSIASGDDFRFLSSYHESGGASPLNVNGLLGILATGQLMNISSDSAYVNTRSNLAFSGNSITITDDSINDRILVSTRAVNQIQSTFPSPIFTDNTVYIIGSGATVASGISDGELPPYQNRVVIATPYFGVNKLQVTGQSQISGDVMFVPSGSVKITMSGNSFVIGATAGGGGGAGYTLLYESAIQSGETLIWNHNSGTRDLQPKLYIKNSDYPSWSEPKYNYCYDNSTWGDFSNFSDYDFTTGLVPFSGWSGTRLEGASFIGFSNGQMKITTNATNSDNTTNVYTAPSMLRRMDGDFDIWTKIDRGTYGNNYNGMGIIVACLEGTGQARWKRCCLDSLAAPGWGDPYRNTRVQAESPPEYAWFQGINKDQPLPIYLRVVKKGHSITFYTCDNMPDTTTAWRVMSGGDRVITIDQQWAVLNDMFPYSVYFGVYAQSSCLLENGHVYTWNWVKPWHNKGIQLVISGENNIRIENYSNVPQDIRVTI